MKKNAMIILIHKMPEQVNLFLKQLLADTTMDIFIHVNKKYDNIREGLIKNERIHVPTNNVGIVWGDDNILRAILLMLQEVRNTGIDYGYVLINTGQDMLLKPGIDEFLDKQHNKIFIDGHEENNKRRAFVMHRWPDFYRKLMDFKLHPIKMMRRFRIEFYTRFPIFEKKTKYNTSNLTFYYNEFWCAIPKEVAWYVLDFCNDNPDFLDIYRDGLVPEEAFMLTLLMRSEYKNWIEFDETGRSHNLTFLKATVNGHTETNLIEDIDVLDNSGCFFSRKFDFNIDKEVVMHYYNKIMNR